MKRILINIAKETGKLLEEQFDLDHSREIHKIKEKFAVDLSTKTDILAESFIIQKIKESGIACTILSEEIGKIDLGSEERKFYVDPLDGTMNFYNRIPIYGTMIALEENNEIKMGVICIPITKELIFAEKNKGTFINNKEVEVRRRNTLDEAIIDFDYAWYGDKKSVDVYLNCVADKQTRRFGCIGFQYSLLAGGKFIDFNGNQWHTKSENAIIASPLIADQLLEKIRD